MPEKAKLAVTAKAADRSLHDELRDELILQLRSALEGVEHVAMLGFPNHGNVGDSAIWLGQLHALRQLDIDVAYQCEFGAYDEEALNRAVAAGAAILFTGGGNFGDLWQGQQELREHVLARFPMTRTVQAPQSIWFVDDRRRRHVQSLVAAHRDFRLMTRERQSFELASNSFDTPVTLSPDAAFGLPALDDLTSQPGRVLVLKRDDKEATHWDVPDFVGNVSVSDWIDDTPDVPVHCGLNPSIFYLDLANHRLKRGIRMLSQNEFLATDRLHGHLLATMLGLPHAILDNSYGKVRSSYETWTHRSVAAAFVESAPDMLKIQAAKRAVVSD